MAKNSNNGIDSVNPLLWTAGWHLRFTIAAVTVLGGVIGYLLDMPFILGTLGFFVSPVVAFVGLRHVNGNYAEVLNEFHSQSRRKAEDLLSFDEDNMETYMLRSGSGEKILRKPFMQYSTVTLLVTDYSLTIHDGNLLDMVKLDTDISESTEEIYFDQIASVNFEPSENDDEKGQLWVNRSDGHGNSWSTDRKPDNALDDIQQRVRDYKRQSAKQ
ncbi:hypothetical protein [Halorussus aquaticus]|uniref:PH domain-containing protein n=1 Tax=Halorussus aquaticus TaxID=2953748 RepID=A0ABD5PXS9_9EURY|nr:hypothetical protein [Halorussus aquaticus]